jgi:DNA-binding CsgD family transcriptional regulator
VIQNNPRGRKAGWKKGGFPMHAVAECAGLLVVDTSFKVVASNREAVQILTFPDLPEQIRHLDMWLRREIRNRLVNGKSPSAPKFVTEIQSAKRTYLCRSFSLGTEPEGCGTARPVLVIILERKSNQASSIVELRRRFALTDREQETVQSILQGLTNKEIAQRMEISPNTDFSSLLTTFRAISLAGMPSAAESDCGSAFVTNRIIVTMAIARPCTALSSNDGCSRRVVIELFM